MGKPWENHRKNIGKTIGKLDALDFIYFMEKKHRSKWMRTGGSPMTKRKPPYGNGETQQRFAPRIGELVMDV